MENQEWKHIKDFVAAVGSEVVVVDFLRERDLPYDSRSAEAVKDIDACILNAETEEGVKSCITTNIEDLHRLFIGPGLKKEASELYEKLKNRATESIMLWSEFIL